MTSKPHIVIIGAGFGGVYAANYLIRELGDEVEITLINRNNYFLFTPLLHEVATGNLSHQSVVEPIVEIFRGTHLHFCQGNVRQIDFNSKTVLSDNCSFVYDYVIISSGAETNTYGISGVKENALMLKNISDALAIRKCAIESIKNASHTADQIERKKLLSFVIVGGGPTGVELAAELSEFIFQVAKSYYSKAISAHEISITLIASASSLIPQFSSAVRAKSLSVLESKGIKVLLNTAVTKVSVDGVETKSGFIPAKNIIWVAGVRVNLPPMSGETHIRNGCLAVNEFLQVEGYTDAFALGDAVILPIKEGEPVVPQLAQSAVAEAKIVAKNISILIKEKQNCTADSNLKTSTSIMSACSLHAQSLIPFTYKQKGILLSLGSWQAAGDIFGFHLSGPLMWFLWRTVYLFKFIPWRKRFAIMSEWTINLFSPRDISEM